MERTVIHEAQFRLRIKVGDNSEQPQPSKKPERIGTVHAHEIDTAHDEAPLVCSTSLARWSARRSIASIQHSSCQPYFATSAQKRSPSGESSRCSSGLDGTSEKSTLPNTL